MSRDRMLANIRTALRLGMHEGPDFPTPVWPEPTRAPWPDLASQFRDRFVALGGHWMEAPATEVGHQVAALAAGLGGRVLVARDPEGILDRLGIAAACEAAGLTVDRADRRPPAPDELQLVVTACTRAIAESGTFGQMTTAGQGRLAGLIGPVHLVVLTPDRLVATLGEFLAEAGPALREGAASGALLITGPSRTADIEGMLVVGVHGPRAIHCLLVRP
ncbi:MAG: lactate utilization protein C [Gemmatimonadales bacterium]